MSAPASRRGLLLGLAALPLMGGVAASSTPAVSPEEAQLLALGPRLIRLLDEYDRLRGPVSAAYKAWERAGDHLPIPRWEALKDLPEWHAYLATRVPSDEVGDVLEALYEPFIDVPLTMLPAIMLRHRYGMSFEAFREDALVDLDRLWWGDRRCV